MEAVKRKTRGRGNFLRFLGYVKPYTGALVLATVGGMVKFLVPLLVPQITRYLIDDVYSNVALSIPQKLHSLLLLVGGMIGVYGLVWVPFTYLRHYMAAKAGNRSVFDLRCELYEHILRQPASFFNEQRSGGIVSRLIGDVAQAQNLVGTALTNVWMDAISLFFIAFFLLRLDAQTAGIAIVTFPAYIFFFRKLGKRIKSSSRAVQEGIQTMSGNAQEKIAGSVVVRAFGREPEEKESFARDSDRLLDTTMKSSFFQSANMAISGFLTGIAPLIVTLFGGWRVIHGDISVGTLVAIGMYLPSLYLPLQRFSELNVVFATSMASLDRIFEIMDSPPTIADRPGATDFPRGECTGAIEFRDVSFGYSEERPVLSHFSIAIRPGERLALVGRSGSGKTTISNLIPRFYDVAGGAVTVDGIDVRDLRLKSLRRHIGMVLQDPVLFSGTIKENILYGNPHASDAEVRSAARLANALDFIDSLPEGFDAEVGERGVSLSGGQKQRITIARAFLKDPRILILDEATSALDADSERLIQEALERLIRQRTTIIIAHRLSTVARADRILVIENGKIVESGTHEELTVTDGVYRKFMALQLRS
jgi:ABC-type multidrug transport system fused ATPase/permease subunit